MTLTKIKQEIKKQANPAKAQIYQRFFKTGKGEYGEGDLFLGLTMPEQRTIAKKFLNLKINEVEQLLHSKYHEHRMIALVIWTYQYDKGNQELKNKIYRIYMKNLKWINNWDLVDVTTPRIVGMHLLNKDKQILYKLAKSKILWERRISMLATFAFIYHNQFKDSIKIAEILLNDKHDLIHKAVGWMLREIGKRDLKTEEAFLNKYYKQMPRTMLRYSIERFPDKKKKYYMKK